MYIYNVTINIDGSIHEEWLSWIQDHIQEVLATGSFVAAKLTQVLVEEEMGGVTYSVQYTANSREDLNEYYRIPCDKRDLNYNKFFSEGKEKIGDLDEYHSHNTYRLNVNEMKKLLLKLDFIKNDINN